MTRFVEKYGPWALVTGASSGIGAEFARELARRDFNLVIVARRLNRLQELADELTAKHGVDVRPVACDLGAADVLGTLEPHIRALEIGLLVNNAGFANTGAVVDNDLERELQLLYVNCRAYLLLAHQLGGRMARRGRGGMIFLSSTSAFAPPALWANYAASKAYELALAEAMSVELRPRGVDVLAVCPGPIRTGLYQAADQDLERTPWNLRPFVLDPADVVAASLHALGRKRTVVVGWGNRIFVQMGRLLPRSVASGRIGAFVAAIRRSEPPRPPASA